MHQVFQACVALLMRMSHLTGISYEALNIWIFVVIHPLITLYFIQRSWRFKKKFEQALVFAKKKILPG